MAGWPWFSSIGLPLGLNDAAIAHQPAFAVQSPPVTNKEFQAKDADKGAPVTGSALNIGRATALHLNGGAFPN
jgi:hypothetical protein